MTEVLSFLAGSIVTALAWLWKESKRGVQAIELEAKQFAEYD